MSPDDRQNIEYIQPALGGLLHREVSPEYLEEFATWLKRDGTREGPLRISPEALRDAEEHGCVLMPRELFAAADGIGAVLERVLAPQTEMRVFRDHASFSSRKDGANRRFGLAAAAAFAIRVGDLGVKVDADDLIDLAKARLPETAMLTVDEAAIHIWPARQGGRASWALTAPGNAPAVRSETFATSTGHAVTAKFGSDGKILALSIAPPHKAAVKIGKAHPRSVPGGRDRRNSATPVRIQPQRMQRKAKAS